MLSIGRIGAGDGYKYLTSQVASQDAARQGERLLGYYERTGHPPGVWVGAQAVTFGLEGVVTEEPMEHLFGSCHHPTEKLRTTEGAVILDANGREAHVPLGRRMAEFRSVEERVAARIAAMDHPVTDEERAAFLVDETAKGQSQAVTGFDLTFSAPKSVSIVWALGGGDIRDQLRAAHEAAWRNALGWIENEVAATRLGRAGVAQVDVEGLCAAAFEHWYNRAGDPQLHTHVAVSAMVLTTDRRWRRLDSRAFYRAAAVAGERYTARLIAEATERLGVGWRHRRSGRSRTLLPEIEGIDDELIAEFSPRAAQVTANLARLVGDYKDRHGYAPDRASTARLAQQAVMEGRPKSQQRTWTEEQAAWSERAARHFDVVAEEVAGVIRDRTLGRQEAQVKGQRVVADDAVRAVLERLEDTGATWCERDVQRHSVAVLRESGVVDADSADELAALVEADLATVAIGVSEPGGAIPERLRRRSDASVFRRAGEGRYTSRRVLDAERRLRVLAAAVGTRPYADLKDSLIDGRLRSAGEQLRVLDRQIREQSSRSPVQILEARREEMAETRAALLVERARRRVDGPVPMDGLLDGLSPDQTAAVARLSDTSRPLDALIGPAGTGKTTALECLASAWRRDGRGVLALAPTAVAAGVLGDVLGIPSDTLDAALGRWERGQSLPEAGTLILIDEASMATSPKLARAIELALGTGAVVRCIGDPRQLKAVGAGGGLSIIAAAAGSASLVNIHRFRQQWEGPASLRLRSGDTDVIGAYEQHGRISGGLDADVVEDTYRSWRDSPAGPAQTLMIASDNATVQALCERARADRVAAGEVELDGVELANGSLCGVGDVVVTRLNDRTIPTGPNPGAGGYVRNRDRWTVIGRSDAGDLAVRHLRGRAKAVLPPAYVSEHVELSYAVTGHGAQGLTVEVAHAIIQPTDTREYAYVALTRGRAGNHAHVVTGELVEEPAGYQPDMTPRGVMEQVLANDEPVSAQDHIEAAVARAENLFELVSRYRYAQTAEIVDRVRPILEERGAGDLLDQPDGWRLRQALEIAEDRGFDSAELVASLDAPGIDALPQELQRACWSGATPAGERARRLSMYAGLVPAPGLHVEADVAKYLKGLGRAMEAKRDKLADQFVTGQLPKWAAGLGSQPEDPDRRERWARYAAQVAAWRESQGITNDSELLGPVLPPGHRDARARAQAVRAASETGGAQQDRDDYAWRDDPVHGPFQPISPKQTSPKLRR